MPGVIIVLKYPIPLFLFNWEGGNVSEYSDLGNCWQKITRNDKNNATLKTVQPKFSPDWGENVGKIISTWNLGMTKSSSSSVCVFNSSSIFGMPSNTGAWKTL